MDLLRDRRVIAGAGGALALVLGLGVAFVIMSRDHGSTAPPPASRGGLVVETGRDDASLDPARPLRCFVGGQFVAILTLGECAQRNGVATRALDVGVDATGALAAASDSGPVIQSLTGDQAKAIPLDPPPSSLPAGAAPSAAAGATATAPCWRRADSDWRRLPSDMTLSACVQTLFAGHCERAGEATYGRWGEETLRLVPRRVEISADNRTFRPLVDQGAGCSVPAIAG